MWRNMMVRLEHPAIRARATKSCCFKPSVSPAVPLAIVAGLVLCAILAPLLAPHSPVEGSLGEQLAPPIEMEGAKAGHLLGTDRHGRDTLSRLVYGARISLLVSVIGISLTGALGSFIGLLAGFLGGWVDTLLMRLVDISLSLPGILIAVLLSVVFEPSFTNVIIVVVFLLWPSYARLVRGGATADQGGAPRACPVRRSR